MAVTEESLPALDSAYPLLDAQCASYRNQGHICLRRVCSPAEIAAYGGLISDAVDARVANIAPMAERDTYGKAFLQIMNLWREDASIARFVLARRFAKIAAELMGVGGVRLYHDQALYKEAGGGFTPWHQDQHYWPLATDHTITMWMPLVNVSEAMGTMNFASGSHKLGYLGDMPISDASESAWDALVAERGFEKVNHGSMRAGDATFHSGWTLHGAPGNQSQQRRDVMTIIYFADGTKVAPADNANRKADLDAWIPGGVPGELAASELNPLLYP